MPGNGVEGRRRNAVATTIASPSHPKPRHSARPPRVVATGTSTASPPSPNSHARAGVPKNAHGWRTCVRNRQPANEAIETTPIISASVRRERPSFHPTTTSHGQTR